MSWQEFNTYMGELNMISTFVRLALAMVCGGILGIERGKRIVRRDFVPICWSVWEQPLLC